MIDVDFYLETKKKEVGHEERPILALESRPKEEDMNCDLYHSKEEMKMEDEKSLESSECSSSMDSEFCLPSSDSKVDMNLNGIPAKNKKRPRK